MYGINDHFDENAHVLPTLIKKFHQALLNNSKNVVVWGTGKPKREFFYVDDLADACLFLLKKYNQSEVINIGVGQETSISQLIKMIIKSR